MNLLALSERLIASKYLFKRYDRRPTIGQEMVKGANKTIFRIPQSKQTQAYEGCSFEFKVSTPVFLEIGFDPVILLARPFAWKREEGCQLNFP